MKSRSEKIQQLNLDKLTLELKLKIKTDDLKVSQTQHTLCGVSCGHSTCTERSNFFSPELDQVDSSMPLELKA